MKRKITWLVLTFLVVTALVLASCRAAPEEKKPVVEEKEPVVEEKKPVVEEKKPVVEEKKPVYGGSLTFYTGMTRSFDPANVVWVTDALVYDALISEDWTKGPSGTGEALGSIYPPTEYLTGWLAERWDVHDLYSVTYYLRKGIRFHNGREFNADDVVYNFNRCVGHEKSFWYNSPITVTKIDKYTVRFNSPTPDPEIVRIGYHELLIGAPEVFEQYGDITTNWSVVVGTGPYTIIDVVPGSSVTYKRNPNYWAQDPLHPGNQLPYIETLVALVITDPSTQDAAMRTGKIAILLGSKERADALLSTTPHLKYRTLPSATSLVLSVRTDLKDKPYADKRVRQALMMAIDHRSIKDLYFLGDAELLQWPFQPIVGSAYTPLEELPENLAKFWDYRPEEAKALLAEAGYPNGFKMEIRVLAGYAGGVELYSIVKNYWDAIGVDTRLTILESGAFWSQVIGKTYTDAVPTAWGNTLMINAMHAHTTGATYNYSRVSDPHIDETWARAQGIVDVKERNALLKELGLYIIEQQYWLHLPTPLAYVLWQPWLKGYSGETNFGNLHGSFGALRFVWIDQDLRR